MNRYLLALVSLFFVNQAWANTPSVEKTYQFIDVSRGLNWLDKTATRIASVVTEVQYRDENTNEIITVKSEIIVPHTPEACQNYDTKDEYTNFFHFLSIEEVDPSKGGYSRWFEGQKLNGPILKKLVTYCFAN